MSKLRSALFVAAATAVACASIASAALFVTTGQTGAQVQCDVNHTQSWTFSVSADVGGIDGALFTMKRGSSATSTVTFRIFEGTLASAGTAIDLLSVSLGPGAFTQSFSGVIFQASSSITLLAGRTYTGMLSSSAPDVQSKAYFIKGGSEAPLSWCDQTGATVSTGAVLTTGAVPTPGAAALLAIAGALSRRRRV